MGLYEGIKDVAKVVQQADNIELYRQLLDLSAQALDMQAEIAKLREENQQLRRLADTEENIVRHNIPYITLANDPNKTSYCAVCWGNGKNLIQMLVVEDYSTYHFSCRNCGNAFFGDLEK